MANPPCQPEPPSLRNRIQTLGGRGAFRSHLPYKLLPYVELAIKYEYTQFLIRQIPGTSRNTEDAVLKPELSFGHGTKTFNILMHGWPVRILATLPPFWHSTARPGPVIRPLRFCPGSFKPRFEHLDACDIPKSSWAFDSTYPPPFPRTLPPYHIAAIAVWV